jgi:hypothetical protein
VSAEVRSRVKKSDKVSTSRRYTPTLRKSGKPPLPIAVEAILLQP